MVRTVYLFFRRLRGQADAARFLGPVKYRVAIILLFLMLSKFSYYYRLAPLCEHLAALCQRHVRASVLHLQL